MKYVTVSRLRRLLLSLDDDMPIRIEGLGMDVRVLDIREERAPQLGYTSRALVIDCIPAEGWREVFFNLRENLAERERLQLPNGQCLCGDWDNDPTRRHSPTGCPRVTGELDPPAVH